MDALQDLHPIGDGYAALPIAAAFNWDEAMAPLGEGEWYLVAFRSIRKAGADGARLEHFDELAHQEAAGAPGFVHYFKGPLAEDRSCLSFCIWSSRADARHAAGQPAHLEAVGLIGEMYERYELDFVSVRRDAEGRVSFAPYDTIHPVHVAQPPEEDPVVSGVDPVPLTGPDPSPAFRPATAG